jgi:Mn2+/Fe2+ NRAMP family transporter
MARRRGSTDEELVTATKDVVTGMLLSNPVMYFIYLDDSSDFECAWNENIETARQAAEALRPLGGKGAYWLFTLGLVGTGMLGVSVLAGSCAYAIAEAARWRAA